MIGRRLPPTLALAALLGGCSLFHEPKAPPPPPPPPEAAPEPTPEPTPSPHEEPELTVKKVEEEIVVAAWAEPKHLPEGGGQAQILVRVQKRGGRPLADVEVRLRTSAGSLYSKGAILTTDGRGMTRDRLTTQKTATIVLNAGGTRYSFQVWVGEPPPTPPKP